MSDILSYLGINPYAMGQRILVLDGHDGAGKTTLARMVADELGGRYVKPFSDSLGNLIAWLHNRADFELADKLCRAAIHKIYEENRDEKLLVFDRHWLTMFTVLPESYWGNWGRRPATICCWVDENTTKIRLDQRGEEPVAIWNHEYFCQMHLKLANQFGVPVENTTNLTVEEGKERICRYAADMLNL